MCDVAEGGRHRRPGAATSGGASWHQSCRELQPVTQEATTWSAAEPRMLRPVAKGAGTSCGSYWKLHRRRAHDAATVGGCVGSGGGRC